MAQDVFQIAVLGDFSGHPHSAAAVDRDPWRPIRIDRDEFDSVMGKLEVRSGRLFRGPAGEEVAVTLKRLADLHPDQLLQAVPLFGQLRQLRHQLQQRETFADAVEAMRVWSADSKLDRGGSPASPQLPEGPPAKSGAIDPRSVLEAAVDASSHADTGLPVGDDMLVWKRLVAEVARPFSQPNIQAAQQQMIAAVDEAMGVAMRAILHQRAFRELESTWRALHFLLFRAETSSQLRVFLVDVTREELRADVGCGAWSQSRLHRLLVEDAVGTAGGAPWSLLVGNFAVGPTPEDVEFVQRLGELAHDAGAPWIMSAADATVGWTGDKSSKGQHSIELADAQAALWRQLRRTTHARHVGLVWPRFLLRLPYGRSAATTKTFAFEELGVEPRTADYLWGNGAFLVGLLIAQSWMRSGSDFQLGEVSTVDRLPLHVYERDGESRAQPCGEVLLSDTAAERVIEQGVMPLVSVRDQDEVSVPRFTSLALDGAPLAGRWNALP